MAKDMVFNGTQLVPIRLQKGPHLVHFFPRDEYIAIT